MSGVTGELLLLVPPGLRPLLGAARIANTMRWSCCYLLCMFIRKVCADSLLEPLLLLLLAVWPRVDGGEELPVEVLVERVPKPHGNLWAVRVIPDV